MRRNGGNDLEAHAQKGGWVWQKVLCKFLMLPIKHKV